MLREYKKYKHFDNIETDHGRDVKIKILCFL